MKKRPSGQGKEKRMGEKFTKPEDVNFSQTEGSQVLFPDTQSSSQSLGTLKSLHREMQCHLMLHLVHLL